jgi:hypothetical protein
MYLHAKIALATLLAAGIPADAAPGDPTRVNFAVHCGSQGILDAPYKITIWFKAPNEDPMDITVSIPNRADSEFIAGAIKAKMNSWLLPPANKVGTDEIKGDPEPSDDAKMKQHDLVVPSGITVLSVTAVREGGTGDGGQLTVKVNRPS